jgi:hypothetical protein
MARSKTPTRPTRKSIRQSKAPRSSRRALAVPPTAGTKLDRLTALLGRTKGASIAEMMEATGWQAHSVRGALAGALRKRGLTINSAKFGSERRYHLASGAQS